MSKYANKLAKSHSTYHKWPTIGERVALLDADLIPYKVGFTIDEVDLIAAKLTVESGHVSTIQETPQFIDAVDQLNWLVNHWVTTAKCDAAKLYLTDSPNQFRFGVAFTQKYKDRKSEKPPFFYELKQYLVEMHDAIVATENEADDLMSIEMWKESELLMKQGVRLGSQDHHDLSSLVCVSIDKDLRINAGMHFNPDKQKHEWVTELGYLDAEYVNKEVKHYEEWPTIQGTPISPASIERKHTALLDTWKRGAKAGTRKTKRVLVGTKPSSAINKLRGAGLMFFYAQLITGDEVDGYSGLKGKGKGFAYDLLHRCKSERELFNAVLGAYREHYGSTFNAKNYRGGTRVLKPYQLMLEQGRLAWMQRYEGELWREGKGPQPPRGDEEDSWT